MHDDTNSLKGSLQKAEAGKTQRKTFELGLSNVKEEEKSSLLRVGGKFLIISNEDQEKGVMCPLTESVAAHHDTLSVFLT